MRGMTSSAKSVMFLTAFHSGMSPIESVTSSLLVPASSAQCESRSATVSGDPQAMRPMATMSSHVAFVPSASAVDDARRRYSSVET